MKPNLKSWPPKARRMVSRVSNGRLGRSARRKGDIARDAADWLAAIRHYRRHLARKPEDYAIWVQLGHALKEAGQLTEAAEAYASAGRMRSTEADLFMSRGHLAKVVGDLKQAAEYYSSAYRTSEPLEAETELRTLYDAGIAARTALSVGSRPIDAGGTLIGPQADLPSAEQAIFKCRTPMERKREQALFDIRARLAAAPPVEQVGPKISVLTPVYNVDSRWLNAMAESILRQTYENWELCLVDDGSSRVETKEAMEELARKDPRIKVLFRPVNGGISAASNDALAMSSGKYVALVDNDDILTVDALAEMVSVINKSDPDWLYSDEFKIDQQGNPLELFSKPDWSPLLLLNYMYTSHLSVYRRSLVIKMGGFRSAYDYSQDYDLALRVAETDPKVAHVDRYLYGWRMIEGSASMGGKPNARISNLGALQDAAERRGWDGEAVALPASNRLVRTFDDQPLVSIIIPSDNPLHIRTAIQSIYDHTTYDNFEIVVVTRTRTINELSGRFLHRSVKWAPYDKTYNFSGKCNAGAKLASGDYFVFFNDDVRVISSDWIESHLEYLALPGVGVVGPKLLYEDGSIQHAGIVTGVRRLVGTAFHTYPASTSSHYNMAQCVREVSVIVGALLAMPAAVFKQIGGFDALNTPIYHSDVDLCFRVREAGYSCVYNPHATLVHIGNVSIGGADYAKKSRRKKKDTSDVYLLKRWPEFIARDPYFPPAMRDLIYIDSQEDFILYPPEAGVQAEAEGSSVAVLTHDLSASGAPKVAFDLAVTLKAQGRFVTVFSPSDGPMRQRLLDAGVAVVIDEIILTGHDAATAPLLHFDLLIANTIVCWQTVDAVSDRVDVYWYTHETELVKHFASTPGFVETLKKPKKLWSGSRMAAAVLETYGVESQVVEYGVDDAARAVSDQKLKVAVFGSYEPRKGQDLAVAAMRRLSLEERDDVQLAVHGRILDGEYHAKILRAADGLPAVRLRGELTYEDYIDALRESDVILVASRDDTLPLVSLDALSCGKVLVVSRTTGTSAYLRSGSSGVILEDNTAEEIADVLGMLASDKRLRDRLARGGRKVFEQHFTQERFARRLTEALS